MTRARARNRPHGLRVLGALFFMVAAATAAPADNSADAYKGWRVAEVSVRGLDDEDLAKQLVSGLALAQKSGLFGDRPTFYTDILAEDLRRCRLFLARHGYPDATIDPEFIPRNGRRSVAVVFRVTPGPAVTVDTVTVTGVPERLVEDARKEVTMHPGDVFEDAAAENARSAIRTLLERDGYARAEVDIELEWPETTAVAVRLAAAPGARYRFGDKRVSGISDDLVPLVKKSMETGRGDWYTPRAIERSRDNLRLLDLFRQVRLETVETGGDTLDVRADLSEREPRVLETGLGYWTDDLLRGRARWKHRNIFKRGRGLQVGGVASAFQQRGDVSTWWPAFIGARTRAMVTYSVERHDEDSYDLFRTGVDLSLTYHHSLRTTARLGAEFSNVNLDVTPEASAELDIEDGRLTVLSLRTTRNGADDRLYPSRGTVSWIDVLWSPPGMLSDNHFVSVEVSGVYYYSLFEGVVLAMRAAAGAAEPIAESVDVLPNYRFYSGGASSMRGFKRRRLGPRDAAGDPIGGETKIEAATELRVPLFWRFRGAVFVDTGQVWARSNDTNLADMAVAVGPGLRLVTPIGPIRTDFGYRVTDVRGTDDPRWVFHLSIGPAF